MFAHHCPNLNCHHGNKGQLFYFILLFKSHFNFKNNSVVQFFIYIFYNFLKQIKNPDYFNFIFYFLFYVLLLLSTINRQSWRQGDISTGLGPPCKLRIKITKRSTGRFGLPSSIITLFSPKHPSQITIILYKKGIHKWDSHSPPPPLHLIKSSSHILPVGPSKNFFSFSFSFLIFFLV